MVTSRLTSTRRRASCREPVDRLTLTMAGSSCGVMPMAMASENSSASSNGRENATLMTKIEIVSTAATRTSSLEKSRRPDLEGGLGLPLAEPDGDLAERGRRTRRHHDRLAGALVHDRAHERARRKIHRRVARGRRDRLGRRHRLAGEHAFVALELARLDETHVGRHEIADAQATTSPGTSSRTSRGC